MIFPVLTLIEVINPEDLEESPPPSDVKEKVENQKSEDNVEVQKVEENKEVRSEFFWVNSYSVFFLLVSFLR